METFVWRADYASSQTTNYRVLSAQFGDGYKQTAADGVHNTAQSWDLTFSGSPAKIAEIQSFLDRHGGHKSFLWAPLRKEAKSWRCASYRTIPESPSLERLSATFEQSFFPKQP